MDDYEIETDLSCPKCGHDTLHSRDCTNLSCEDGYIDEYEDDPINFAPGEEERPCRECRGTGIERWCPKCGTNLSGFKFDESAVSE